VWTLLGNTLAKKCNLLLNIGPQSDGEIPPDAVFVLRNVGKRISYEGWPIASARGASSNETETDAQAESSSEVSE